MSARKLVLRFDVVDSDLNDDALLEFADNAGRVLAERESLTWDGADVEHLGGFSPREGMWVEPRDPDDGWSAR